MSPIGKIILNRIRTPKENYLVKYIIKSCLKYYKIILIYNIMLKIAIVSVLIL